MRVIDRNIVWLYNGDFRVHAAPACWMYAIMMRRVVSILLTLCLLYYFCAVCLKMITYFKNDFAYLVNFHKKRQKNFERKTSLLVKKHGKYFRICILQRLVALHKISNSLSLKKTSYRKSLRYWLQTHNRKAINRLNHKLINIKSILSCWTLNSNSPFEKHIWISKEAQKKNEIIVI